MTVKKLSTTNNNQSELKEEFELLIQEISTEVLNTAVGEPIKVELEQVIETLEEAIKVNNENIKLHRRLADKLSSVLFILILNSFILILLILLTVFN